jgi:ABC-2 type transport system permease protein
MRSVYTKTLYQKRYFTFGWSLGLAILIVFTIIFFPSLKTGDIATSFANLPASLQSLVGDASAFQTIEGYIKQQVFLLRAPLILTICTIMLFAALTVGEEQRKLVETQLSLPIRRSKLLLHKLLAGLTISVVAASAILLAIMFGTALIGESYHITDALPLAAACLAIALTHALLAFALGAGTGKRGLTIGIASAYTLACFVINSMATSIDALKTADKFTFFHYYQPGEMLMRDWALLGIACILFIAVGFLGFVHRDLRN